MAPGKNFTNAAQSLKHSICYIQQLVYSHKCKMDKIFFQLEEQKKKKKSSGKLLMFKYRTSKILTDDFFLSRLLSQSFQSWFIKCGSVFQGMRLKIKSVILKWVIARWLLRSVSWLILTLSQLNLQVQSVCLPTTWTTIFLHLLNHQGELIM